MPGALKIDVTAVADRGDVDPDEILARARSLVPALRSRAAETEKAREVPSDTMDDLRRLGLMRLLQPRRFGGLQSSVPLFSRVVEELAYGCASSAWVYAVFGEHAWIIASMPEQAQIDVWGRDPQAVASSSLVPRAVATRVSGGYRLSGRYPFSSGCGRAQWAIVGTLGEQRGEDERYMLVPLSDIEIVDDWDVLGLRGTGSKTLALHDVFVPEHRTVLLNDLLRGTTPGRLVHPDYPLVGAPRLYLCIYSQVPVAITLGHRALDAVATTLRTRLARAARKVAESEVVQLKLAQSAAEIESATLIFRARRQESMDAVNAGRAISVEDVSARRRDVAFVYQLIRGAVERLCDIAGTLWVYDANPLQAMLRDVLTVSTHGIVNPHNAMIPDGRLRLGLPAEA